VEWFEQIAILLLSGLFLYVMWKASRPPRVFVIVIANGEPTPSVGIVTPAFLQIVREIAAEHRIESGRVWGEAARANRIRLAFSPSFPAAARQQLRNWWAASGWSAGPRRRR
jgi:hypothetical protein